MADCVLSGDSGAALLQHLQQFPQTTFLAVTRRRVEELNSNLVAALANGIDSWEQ